MVTVTYDSEAPNLSAAYLPNPSRNFFLTLISRLITDGILAVFLPAGIQMGNELICPLTGS